MAFVASTIVGEGVDSVVFMLLAFGGAMAMGDLIATTVTIYVFKVVYEVIATPFSTRFANWLKVKEGLDVLDDPKSTNYSPFAV